MERSARHNCELEGAAVAALNAVDAGSDRVGLVDGDGPVATIDANGTAGTPVIVVDNEVCAAVRGGDGVTAEVSLRAGEKGKCAQKDCEELSTGVQSEAHEL
jgi:hypothetical protein